MTRTRPPRRLLGAALAIVILSGCSLFSDSDSKSSTTTSKPNTSSEPPSTTTQPPGDAGVEVLKPVLNQLMEDSAGLRDELMLNKGAALLDPDSRQRAAFIDLFAPGSTLPDELLDAMADNFVDGYYLEPFPGETKANWAWVVEVFPRPNGGTLNEVEFTSCEERKGVVVGKSGNKSSETVGVAGGRLEARRYDGVWKIHSQVETLDDSLCAGGHPT